MSNSQVLSNQNGGNNNNNNLGAMSPANLDQDRNEGV